MMVMIIIVMINMIVKVMMRMIVMIFITDFDWMMMIFLILF